MNTALKKSIVNIVESIVKDDHILYLWVNQLGSELNKIERILKRRGDSDMLEYFIRRLIQYKVEYPQLGLSGDFELIKRIILAEIRLDELEGNTLEELAESPKLIDAFTRLHTQLQKDIDSLGTTSKSKNKSNLEELKVLINMEELKNSNTDEDLKWLDLKSVVAIVP